MLTGANLLGVKFSDADPTPKTNPQTGLKVKHAARLHRSEGGSGGYIFTEIKDFEHPDGSSSHAAQYDTWNKGKKTTNYHVITKDKEGNILREIKTGDLPIRKKSAPAPKALKSLQTLATNAVVKNEAIHPVDFYTLPTHLQAPLLNQAVSSGKTEFAAELLKTKFIFDRAKRALIKLGIRL